MLGILEFITTDEAYAIVNRLLDAAPSGSLPAIACPTCEVGAAAMEAVIKDWNDSGATPAVLRSAAQLARFFDGLELLEPGLVPLPRWRPDEGTLYADKEIGFFCGAGRRP